MRMRTLCIGLLAGAWTLAACGESEPAAGEGATIVDDATTSTASDAGPSDAAEASTSDEPTPTEAAEGTRDNPVAVGTTVDLGDGQVAIMDVTTDATEQVMAENQFNDPPAEGRQFVMWTVDASYTGEDSGTAWVDLGWGFVGNAGNTFNFGEEDYCGSIPNNLQDTGETFPGGNVTGNVCISVPSEQIQGGTIFVENSLSFDNNRVFFQVP